MVFVLYVKENINIVFFMLYTWNCRDVLYVLKIDGLLMLILECQMLVEAKL
jgi:hypothetical protein